MEPNLPMKKTLVEEYFVLRTNSIQRRRFQTDQVYGHLEDETNVRLLRDVDDIESHRAGVSGPPSFVGQSEALQYQMKRTETKIKQLHDLHLRHIRRPTMDEVSQEEADIKSLGLEITQMFEECHHQIKSIRRNTLYTATGVEEIIVKNLITYLSGYLQDLTSNFGQSQNEYLKHLSAREKKSAQFFDLDEDVTDPLTEALDQKWSDQNQMLLQDNTRFVQLREQEINEIVQSIGHLNVIFKELAQMVTEQGTIIDRIDYNIENTNIKVHDGLEQIKKAAMYQKSDKKMHCIVILAVIVILELLILVMFKFR